MRFVMVARSSEIAEGSALRCQLGERGLVLVKQGGVVYALADRCTHEAASLAEGYVEERAIECPHHGARFDLRTGEPLCLPATQGVATYPVRIDGEAILVGLDPGAEPAEQVRPPATEETADA